MKKLLILAAVLFGCHMAQAQMGLATTALPLAAKINANKTVYRDFTLYRYSTDGVIYKAYYNNRGGWLYTILSYAEGNLPASIRNRVNSAYDNYRITWVDEIRAPGRAAVYRVQLNSCHKFVIVQVNEEEMAQEAEYNQ